MTIPEAPPPPPPPASTRFRPDPRPLSPGLHFLATPIGAARDITLRALDILATADVLAAEDTRSLRHLMEIHGVALGDRHIHAYHDHNGEAVRPRLMAALAEGRTVAYASEAGTPLVADPGFQLARAAIAAGHGVWSAPGPSAVLAALTVAGLPTDRFTFAGFAPAAGGARAKFLTELADLPGTLVLYESPKRINRLLTELRDALGGGRDSAVCRELTKRFEEVSRGTLAELADAFADRVVKGEIVVLVGRAPEVDFDPVAVREGIRGLLEIHRVKDAAAEAARRYGLPRKDAYRIALEVGKEKE